MNEILSRLALIQYSFLAFPLAFIGLPLYMHAPDFYAAQAGVSLAAMGGVLLFIRLFDAVQDPIIGVLSHRFSYLRHVIMLGALVVLALGFFMLFHPPQNYVLLWFAVSLLLATTAFSVLSINLNTLGSLWSKDTHHKTRIASWREAFGLIGLLVAAVLPSLLGLPLISVLFVGLIAISAGVFLVWNRSCREIITHHEGGERTLNFSLLCDVRTVKFFTLYALSMLASAIPAVLVLFFVRDRLDAEMYTGLFLFLYFVSGAIGMPIWQKLAKRKDKFKAWFVAMIVAVFAFVWAYFLGEGDVWQYAVICIVSGFALGAELALPPAILSDMIDEKDERGQTSLYFSVLAFLAKLSLALGSAIAFFILGQASFVPAADNSVQALQYLSITYALIPCFVKLLAAYLLWRFYQHKGENYAQNERNSSYGTHSIS